MITIQQAGSEILTDKPGKLYFFLGSEFGVKRKYLDHLKQCIGNYVVSDTVEDLIKIFEKKQLIATPKSLYVCRYDSEFIKTLDQKQADRLLKCKYDGCLVCIYEDEKDFKKLDKYFPNNVVRFDAVDSVHVAKYLESDYPNLDSRYCKIIADKSSSGYGQAYNLCNELSYLGSYINKVPDEDILFMLKLEDSSTEDQLMVATAAKSFTSVMRIVDNFDGDLNYLINCFCHVAIELDKTFTNRRTETIVSKYIKKWSMEDIYNFFEQCYTQTLKLRSYTNYKVYDCIVYLASLLKFTHIPSIKQVS